MQACFERPRQRRLHRMPSTKCHEPRNNPIPLAFSNTRTSFECCEGALARFVGAPPEEPVASPVQSCAEVSEGGRSRRRHRRPRVDAEERAGLPFVSCICLGSLGLGFGRGKVLGLELKQVLCSHAQIALRTNGPHIVHRCCASPRLRNHMPAMKFELPNGRSLAAQAWGGSLVHSDVGVPHCTLQCLGNATFALHTTGSRLRGHGCCGRRARSHLHSQRLSFNCDETHQIRRHHCTKFSLFRRKICE